MSFQSLVHYLNCTAAASLTQAGFNRDVNEVTFVFHPRLCCTAYKLEIFLLFSNMRYDNLSSFQNKTGTDFAWLLQSEEEEELRGTSV